MFFTKFPSTKLQDVNLDWLLKKICKLRGGSRNQVLAKASDADFDFKWVTGGGGGGTSDYNDLVNQPQINNVALIGNLSASDLGLLDPAALTPYRTAAAQDVIDATKQAKIAASGMLKGDGDGGVTAATAGTDYLAPAALMPYRTAAAQDAIDATKQAKIAASGLLKGDGDGGVTAATAGTDYLAPAALMPYRTAAAQDVIDAAQDVNINTRAQAEEIAIVINGNSTETAASVGQYIIVRNSIISGITDGLYTAAQAIPANTAIDSTYLRGPISGGGLNDLVAVEHLPCQAGQNVVSSQYFDRTGPFCFPGGFFEITAETKYEATLLVTPKAPPSSKVIAFSSADGSKTYPAYVGTNGAIFASVVLQPGYYQIISPYSLY